MRGVPASAAMTRDAVMTPYSTAMTPQPITAHRTEDIIVNLLFLKVFSTRSAPMKSVSPSGRRAENDRTLANAQQQPGVKAPSTQGLGLSAGGMAQAEYADHQQRDADQG